MRNKRDNKTLKEKTQLNKDEGRYLWRCPVKPIRKDTFKQNNCHQSANLILEKKKVKFLS